MNKNGRIYKDDEHDLLIQHVLADHDLTCGYISRLPDCRVAERQVFRFSEGECKGVPMWFWKMLYKLTKDHRILQLITGDNAVMVVDLPEIDETLTGTGLANLVKITKASMGIMEPLTDIYADGKADYKDRAAKMEFDRSADKLIKATLQLKHAISLEMKTAKEQPRRR